MEPLVTQNDYIFCVKHASLLQRTCVSCHDDAGEDLPLVLAEHLREHPVGEVHREGQAVHFEEPARDILVYLGIKIKILSGPNVVKLFRP
jgi:hypothetical protein